MHANEILLHAQQLQAFFLVADDIMDNSITRRGQPCWYRVPEVRQRSILPVHHRT